MSFQSMLRGLTEARVAFVVVGGVAATAHGSTYVTNDLEICYETTPENIERLATLLAQWNAYPRGIEHGLPFFMDARTFSTTPTLTLQTTEGAIDVLDRVDGVGPYRATLEHSDAFDIFGLEIRVLSLPALIAAKRAAARPKDFAQLPELEAILALRK